MLCSILHGANFRFCVRVCLRFVILWGFMVFYIFAAVFTVYHQVLFLVGRADRIELHIVWRRQERLIQLLHIVYHGCNMVHHAVCTSCLFQSHQTSFLALAYVWYGCATFWFRYVANIISVYLYVLKITHGLSGLLSGLIVCNIGVLFKSTLKLYGSFTLAKVDTIGHLIYAIPIYFSILCASISK